MGQALSADQQRFISCSHHSQVWVSQRVSILGGYLESQLRPAYMSAISCDLLWSPRILEFSTGSSVGSSEEDEKRREECGKSARVEGLGRFSGARPRGGGRALYSHPIGQSSVMWSHLTAREDGKCSLVWYGGKGNEFVEQLVRLCLTCKCLWARQVTCRSEASRMSWVKRSWC